MKYIQFSNTLGCSHCFLKTSVINIPHVRSRVLAIVYMQETTHPLYFIIGYHRTEQPSQAAFTTAGCKINSLLQAANQEVIFSLRFEVEPIL